MTEQQQPALEQQTIDTAADAQSFGGEWLPSWRQMQNALRLRFDSPEVPVDEEDSDAAPYIAPDSVYYASMRQGLGMVFLAGIVAGVIPFLWSWISSARIGASVPLASLGDARLTPYTARRFCRGTIPIAAALQTIAGLQPAVFPGWLASGVSAFGLWLNTPLQWLAAWIVYGLLVLLVAKVMGAGTTLQQFYTVTSFDVSSARADSAVSHTVPGCCDMAGCADLGCSDLHRCAEIGIRSQYRYIGAMRASARHRISADCDGSSSNRRCIRGQSRILGRTQR